ncbi:MAG: Rab family GTPase [Promethearchaeota archaeon]
MKYSASFKVCIFGDAGVGKTSLTYRYINNRFEQDTKLTLGVDIMAKDIEMNGSRVKLQVWDFGGEERFRIFLPVYARGSSGGIFMYDLTRKSSLNKITDWISIFKKDLTKEEKQIPVLAVGGKLDLANEREIDYDHAKNLANNLKIYDIIECSAKTGENVNLIFDSITNRMLKDSKLI